MAKLIFVYNAESGFMNGMFDFFHKLIHPSTYACSLCMITYNYKGMRSAWKKQLESLPIEKEFLHTDAFAQANLSDISYSLPAVFIASDHSPLEEVVSSEELNTLDLPGLMLKIKEVVSQIEQ